MLSMNSSTSCFWHVPEVLGHRQRGQPDPQPGARRLVHLPEHQRGLVDDAGLGHLQEQVVALAGALADAGEHRHAAELLRDPADHLLDQHGLADASATEQADLAAGHVRGEQVDDLDAGLQQLGLALELVERRCRPVDRPRLAGHEVRVVQAAAERVEHVPLDLVADRHLDRVAGVGGGGAADEPVGRLHRDRPHRVVADVLGDLQGELLVERVVLAQLDVDVQRVVQLRQLAPAELDVHDRAGDPHDSAGAGGFLYRGHDLSLPAAASASAPPTISLISWVISDCRAWLASRV
jgi:peptide chain release factor 1